MAAEDTTEDYGSWLERETHWDLQDRQRKNLRNAVEVGHKARAAGDYDRLAGATELIQKNLGKTLGELREIVDEFEGSHRAYPTALRDFYHGDHSRVTTEKAFDTLETILQYQGITEGNVRARLPVKEYTLKIGERLIPPRQTDVFDEEQQLIDPDGDPEFTLYVGETGSGKSSGLETAVDDRLEHGHKIMDILDLEEVDNGLYDVPQKDPDLIQARENLIDDDSVDPTERDIEIYAPLTKTLVDHDLSFDTDAGEFTVKPFTIPASELSKTALRMLAQQTSEQQKYVAQAYERVEHGPKDDWTLEDIRRQLDEDKLDVRADTAQAIENSLRNLQMKGFVRDKQSDYNLDWMEIFQDTDTVTTFTMMYMDDDVDRYAVLSYLIQKIIEERRHAKRRHIELPVLSLVAREVQNIAPKKGERHTDPRISKLQRYMTSRIRYIAARCRHIEMEFLADCQKPKSQLDGGIFGHADRVQVYKGQRPDIKEAFKTRLGLDDPEVQDAVSAVAKYEDPGKCALVSSKGYIYPLVIAPPSYRHFDTGNDINGIQVRSDELPQEELREPTWDAEVPNRLKFDVAGDQEITPEHEPVKYFLDKALEESSTDRVWARDLRLVYEEYAERHDLSTDVSKKEFFSTFKEHFDVPESAKGRPTHPVEDKSLTAYQGFRFKDTGREIAQRHPDIELE